MKNKHYKMSLKVDDLDAPFEKIKTSTHKSYSELHSRSIEKTGRVIFDTKEFKCAQCGFFVTPGRESSGVNNRNHCPRCLWSKHVDLVKPGDRKADCLSRMEPIGLTIKQTRKHYSMEKQGELMLIHQCSGCGKLSINRIAADDDASTLYQLFLLSSEMDPNLNESLADAGILLLGSRDLTTVYTQLFGWQPLLEEFRNVEKLGEVIDPEESSLVLPGLETQHVDTFTIYEDHQEL